MSRAIVNPLAAIVATASSEIESFLYRGVKIRLLKIEVYPTDSLYVKTEQNYHRPISSEPDARFPHLRTRRPVSNRRSVVGWSEFGGKSASGSA